MSKFRVALSSDFVKPDGSLAYPMFDTSALTGDHIEHQYLQCSELIDAAEIADFDALILLGHRFSADSVPNNNRLALIARFGVGYDTVDVAACSEHNIALAITPDGVRRPVAVAVISFMLALTGKLFGKDRITRQGPEGWRKRSDMMGVGLVGKTLGIIGLGNIGAEVVRMAQPFELNFIAHDPYIEPTKADQLGVKLVDLDELFSRADIVSVNCPLSEHTHHLVNAHRLALMKPNAYLINTARGPVVDEQALTKVLQQNKIAGAGLDVFEQEPSASENPLFALDNVIVTPHALCWTDQCFAGMGKADVMAALNVMQGKTPNGIVNRDILTKREWLTKLEHYRSQFGG